MPGFAIPLNGTGCKAVPPDPLAPNARMETSRVYRYQFNIFQPLDKIKVICHKSDRPIPEIDRITMHHGQDEIYWPGKNRWRPIEITFYEGHLAPNTDSTCKAIYDWWSKNVVNIAFSQIVTKFKQNCSLQMLDGNRNPVWTYSMYGCWPSLITPSSLNYSESEIAEVTVRVEMDKCVEDVQGGFAQQQTPDGGIQSESPLINGKPNPSAGVI